MGILMVIIWFALGIYTFFIMFPLCEPKMINIIGLFLVCTTGGAFLALADLIIEIMGVFLPQDWEQYMVNEEDDGAYDG